MTVDRSPPGRRRGDGRIGIALLTPTLAPGGAERQMLLLASALPRTEFHVRMIVLSEMGAWGAEAERLGIRVDVLGLDRGAFLRRDPHLASSALRALRHYVAVTRHVDIVDAWHVPSFTFAAAAQPFVRVPILLAGRRSTTDLYATKPWFQRAAAAWASRFVDGVVANSEIAAGQAIDVEGIPAEKVHVIPNAVIPIEPDPEVRRRLRDGWAVGPDDLVIGCVANYKPGKGLEDLLTAAQAVREDEPRARFVLVGEGPSRSILEATIQRSGLGDNVILTGAVADARSAYGAFDVLVQASHSEGLPNVVLEGAAAGLPIVATAVGGTAEIVRDGETALLVAPSDPAALAGAILRVVHDPDLRGRLASSARRRADDFSVRRLADTTAALYRDLLEATEAR
jgi:glycosyltransferase involved in cell wall biosynthesis